MDKASARYDKNEEWEYNQWDRVHEEAHDLDEEMNQDRQLYREKVARE